MLHQAFTVYLYFVENVYLYRNYGMVGSFRAGEGSRGDVSPSAPALSLCRHMLCVVT